MLPVALGALQLVLAAGCVDDVVLGPPHQGLPSPEEELSSRPDASTGGSELDGGELDRPAEGPCDLTGRWMIQVVTFSTPDTALANGAQKTSTWLYYEVRQSDDAFEVTRGLWCDTFTSGTANVAITSAAKRAMGEYNPMAGRKGSYRVSGEGCAFEIDRLYTLYSLGPYAKFLGGLDGPPGVIASEPNLSELEPLPTTPEEGAEDWDEDDAPGMQWVISDSPLGSGIRHSVQRQWNDMTGTTDQEASDFRVDVSWDMQENILDASSPFLMTGAKVRGGAPHTARWLRTDVSILGSSDEETCNAIIEAMPHQPEPKDSF